MMRDTPKKLALTTQCAAVLFTLVAIVALTVASRAQSLSLYGTVRRSHDAGDGPVIGARVYLRGGSEDRIGPALSDEYGRYAFYGISPGRYHVMVYVDETLKWQDDVLAPGRVNEAIIP